ncbi:hypothetical protein ND486_20575 [Pseudonocardia sp. DR1-2]|uniref:hypothetical protein n=1 Tax=Pseudonocardia sp. DR1-2 TaxID=2951168 RepID=UPI0020434E35|nr:hypothetical protein [Pseudonocardia sp. DR1-2]MCM3848586.1 hypothetical protein [Pseudonocardia sp. DR1-2]
MLGFALIVIVLLSLLQAIRFYKDGKWSINYIVLVGLIVVAALATTLALSAIPDTVQTAAFTLFGTIAGYLATRKIPTASSGGANDTAGVSTSPPE